MERPYLKKEKTLTAVLELPIFQDLLLMLASKVIISVLKYVGVQQIGEESLESVTSAKVNIFRGLWKKNLRLSAGFCKLP
jgi:hypothetical protein